jgi:hypothetical protein
MGPTSVLSQTNEPKGALGEFRGSAFNGVKVGQIQEKQLGFLPGLRFKVFDRSLAFLFTAPRDVHFGAVLQESLGTCNSTFCAQRRCNLP